MRSITSILEIKKYGVVYKRRIEEAMQEAQKAIKEIEGDHSLSYSGGKDSTVMLDICLKAGFKGELIQFFYSEFENPEMNLEIADMMAKKNKLKLHRLKCYSSKEAWDEAGRFYVVPSNDLEKKLVRKVSADFGRKWIYTSFYRNEKSGKQAKTNDAWKPWINVLCKNKESSHLLPYWKTDR